MPEAKPIPKPKRNPKELQIIASSEGEVAITIARLVTGPRLSSALVQTALASKLIGIDLDLTETRRALLEASDRIKNCDLNDVESMLYSQASALNLMFAEMNRRALNNIYDGHTFEAGRQYMGLALKAQNQSRMTLETLGNIVNPPAVFAKQANIAHGPQQVNNGTNPRAPATENEISPNKLLEPINEQRMDIETQGQAGGSNTTLEAVDAFDRTKVG